MAQKIPSEIIRIELDDATFEGTKTAFTPTYVNFFFGNNGTGKSTIAKAIKTGKGITYADGKRFEDYIPLVYNQEFINDNMRSYHDLKGIFTFDEVNSDIQEEVDRLNAQMAQARAKKTAADTAKGEAEKQLSELDDKSMKSQYTALKGLRDKFGKLIPSKYGTSKTLMPVIRRHVSKAARQDEDEMKRQYDAIFGSDAKEYKEFSVIDDTAVLDTVEGAEILGVVIANAAQTAFAQFLDRIGATQWMREAHEKFLAVSEGRCPYCYRTLQPDFEQMFIDSFDNQYDENIKKLNAFLQAYRDQANALYPRISKLPDEVYPGVDEKAYREKLEMLKAAINDNLVTIRSKISEPSKIVSLVELKPILDDISEMIDGINKMIRTNNEAFGAQAGMITSLQENLFCHMAHAMLRDFRVHDQSRKLITDRIEAQKKVISDQTAIISQLRDSLRGKRGSVKDTTVAMKNINNMLRDANFQGFEMRPHVDPSQPAGKKPINYEVVRTSTGKVAVDLSEGEKNFIAFLYFLQKVFGNETDQQDSREKIVVIDDPVSSMDSSTLFIVGEQIRKMVEVCRNNADNRNALVKGNFIKQIFVLTHNAYFHREVTYPHADRYEFVSFYLVRKINNRSSVRLCDKQDSEEPTSRINVNPVKNSYAALWEEYKELSSAVPLMNTIRRILEYYFMQLCGYEGSKLRETILEENRDAFTHDENGNEDNTKYDMASTMLSYIDATSYGVNDGLHYVDDGVDVELYRETFRMIFELMNQGQHYNMMMGIKKGGR
ncbi:MAG: AAA family ATPase [Acidaminococcaceae bacterium]|nr:AAA family ATPase [Acidaminococcaceae bacterium]